MVKQTATDEDENAIVETGFVILANRCRQVDSDIRKFGK